MPWDCAESLPPHPQTAHLGIFLILGGAAFTLQVTQVQVGIATSKPTGWSLLAGPFWPVPSAPHHGLSLCLGVPGDPAPSLGDPHLPMLLLPLSTPGAAFPQGQAGFPSSTFCPVLLLYLLLPLSVLAAFHPEVLRAAPAITSFLLTPTCDQSLSTPCLGALGWAEGLVQDKPRIQRG